MGYKAELTLEKNYKIRIKSNHQDYIKDMAEEFAIHVPNYYFMGKYKSGMWDGKVHFITESSLMPYGLLLDFLKLHKKIYPDIQLKPDDGIKSLFKGPKIDIKYDLSLTPRPYQQETIETMLKYTKGIIRSATASGKSLAIAYIMKNLLVNRAVTNVHKGLIVVPSTSLVEQFKNDMISYKIPENIIGKVYTGYSEWEKPIVISTWQTLQHNHKKIPLYDCMIGDECHQNKADEIKKIFSKSKAKYRLGFTGTLPNAITDLYNIKSYLGPVLKEYPSGLLANQGYIAKCTVRVIKMLYPDGVKAKDYKGIKDEVFHNRRRLSLISDIVNEKNDNVLLLVSYISEGKKLVNLLNRKTKKEVVFLSGKDKTEVREEWRQKLIKNNNIAIIATYGIFQQGINIPNLKYAILTSPTKSKIRTLQSVGRTLRLHDNKKDGAVIYDIIDEVKFLSKHGQKRISYYETEGFNIKKIDHNGFLSLNDVLL